MPGGMSVSVAELAGRSGIDCRQSLVPVSCVFVRVPDSDSYVSRPLFFWPSMSWRGFGRAHSAELFQKCLRETLPPELRDRLRRATSHPQARGEASSRKNLVMGVRLRFRHVRDSSDASGFPQALTESSRPFASHRRDARPRHLSVQLL